MPWESTPASQHQGVGGAMPMPMPGGAPACPGAVDPAPGGGAPLPPLQGPGALVPVLAPMPALVPLGGLAGRCGAQCRRSRPTPLLGLLELP